MASPDYDNLAMAVTADTSGRITRPGQIVALAALGMIGNIAAYALPVNVGALVDSMRLQPRMAGIVGTAELVGLAGGSIVFSALILRVGWRHFAFVALTMTIVASAATPYLNSLPMLLAVRAGSGLGGGMVLSMAAAGLASTVQPERILGTSAIFSLLFSGAILYCFPLVLTHWGAAGLFFSIAGINIVALVIVPAIPARSPFVAIKVTIEPARTAAPSNSKPDGAGIRAPVSIGIPVSTLSGIFLFFTGAMGFWVFFERAGVAAHFSSQLIASALGSSQVVGAVGAVAAATIGVRLGNRLLPVGGAILLAAGAAAMMAAPLTATSYVLASWFFVFGWSFLYPYLMGIAISLDSSARLASYSLVLQTAGKALGPALAAMLVVGSNYVPVYWMALALFLASLACLTPAVVFTDRRLQKAIRAR